ncbi:cupin domain-containing protein [Neorhizobium petrolearium]|uniref:cupin domain-containing protein n=1 Tax=Neorhizobium petrolearium TaxID=515361 RepID=UPI003F14217B
METIKIGGLVLEFLQCKDRTDGSLDLFRMTVEPKAKVPAPHYHQSWDETVYGLAGALTFRIDGIDHLIAPGETAFIARGVVHSFRNDGDAPATVLNVLTPGVLGPAYFRDLAGLMAAGTQPDPAKVKEIMDRYGLIAVAA